MAATNVQAFSGDVEVVDSITKKHNTTYNLSADGWYKVGTWDASAAGANTGARLLLTLIGGAGYDQGTSGYHGGETKIAATILNDDGGTTNANIRGSFWHIGGVPIATNVVFVEANADRLQYHVYAYILAYTTHAMDVDTTLNTTFTKTFTSVSNPGSNGPTVQAATLSFISRDGNVGIGTTDPVEPLHIRGSNPQMLIEGATNENANIDFSAGPIYRTRFHRIQAEHYAAVGFGHENRMNFRVNDGTEATPSIRMTIRGDGRVGIGTTNPGARLQVGDGLIPASGTRDADGSISVYGTGQKKVDQGKPGIYHRENVGLGVHSDYEMSFEVNGSTSRLEAMRINSAGRVGIGLNAPGAKFDIFASSSNPSIPTVHIGDNAVDHGGGYGMVNLVRNPTGAGTKAHLAFIRNGNTVFGQGFCNNTNTFGFWPGFGSVANTPALSITTGNRIGILTTNPRCPLDVYTTVTGDLDVDDTNDGYILTWNGVYQFQNYTTQNVAINADYNAAAIAAHVFVAGYSINFLSDRRIKKDIKEIDDESALEKFRLLKPSKYKYIEPLLSGRTDKEVYGYIAQEVAEVLPEAVTICDSDENTDQGHIPNIMSMCRIESQSISSDAYDILDAEQKSEYIETGNTYTRHVVMITETIDLDTFSVIDSTPRYKMSKQTKTTGAFDKRSDGEYHPLIFYSKNLQTIRANIVRVIDDSSFVVDKNLLDVDKFKNDKLLLYGQKPNDFHRLNKDAIFTLATAALQEVDRQLQAEKAKVASLETQLTSVLARLDALESA